MTNLRQAAQQALEALEQQRVFVVRPDHEGKEVTPRTVTNAITALRAALAEPEQEPVAWLYRDSWGTMKLSQIMPPPVGAFPVYTAPAPRKPLTDYINAAGINGADSPHMVVEKLQSAIERAHGIGEQT